MIGVFDDVIIKRYNEPHRKYHNLNHIIYCLNLFEEVKELSLFPEDTKLAIWFHDLIYDTQRPYTNELESAGLAEDILRNLGYPKIRIKNVYEMIRATSHLSVNHTNLDTKILLDIDLSIFGDPDYNAYEKAIREEYGFLTEEDYKVVRKDILESFLDERIYLTDYFYDKFEALARKNLTQAIKNLER